MTSQPSPNPDSNPRSRPFRRTGRPVGRPGKEPLRAVVPAKPMPHPAAVKPSSPVGSKPPVQSLGDWFSGVCAVSRLRTFGIRGGLSHDVETAMALVLHEGLDIDEPGEEHSSRIVTKLAELRQAQANIVGNLSAVIDNLQSRIIAGGPGTRLAQRGRRQFEESLARARVELDRICQLEHLWARHRGTQRNHTAE